MSEVDLYCTVISLVPFEINEEKPGLNPSRFHLDASDMKTPEVLQVGTCRHFVYLDEDRGHLPVRTPSHELARSIVFDYISSQMRIAADSKPALFWLPNALTASQIPRELCDEHLNYQQNWFMAVCRQADDDWTKYHRHTVVSDVQRRMAQILGWNPEQHEWMAPNVTSVGYRCPACGTLAMMGAVVCSNCRCVLDAAKYETLQFAKGV